MKKMKNVLLIDDDKVDRMLVSRVAQRSGLVENLIEFESALTALEYLKGFDYSTETIDAIFLDINMPKMNGFEFLEAATEDIGQSFTRIVVIMLTTSIEPRDIEKAESINVVKEYINKPLTVDSIKFITAKLGPI